jgi:hypothetical protein
VLVSPPVPKAWTIRRAARAATAKSPAFAAEGNSPTAAVAAHVDSVMTRNGRRRPTRSEKWPTNTEPTGRINSAPAKTTSTDVNPPRPAVTTTPSKAAEAPKVAKSYHSARLPR